jgi:hypothetical protein
VLFSFGQCPLAGQQKSFQCAERSGASRFSVPKMKT